jgi:hypothetical protein
MVCQRGSGSRGCRRVNIESGQNSDDRLAIDRDVPTLPIPVLGGDAERLSQVVESGVQFCHGANLGSYHTRCGASGPPAPSIWRPGSSAWDKQIHDEPRYRRGNEQGVKAIHDSAMARQE